MSHYVETNRLHHHDGIVSHSPPVHHEQSDCEHRNDRDHRTEARTARDERWSHSSPTFVSRRTHLYDHRQGKPMSEIVSTADTLGGEPRVEADGLGCSTSRRAWSIRVNTPKTSLRTTDSISRPCIAPSPTSTTIRRRCTNGARENARLAGVRRRDSPIPRSSARLKTRDAPY